MKKLTLSLLALSFLSTAVLAAPQGFNANNQTAIASGPVGFNNNAPNTVSGVLENGYDDQIVTLRGKLTNYLGQDNYEFTDVQGNRIEVELDDDYNWSHIAKDQLIEITGEVDKDILSTTIEVKRAVVVAN